MILTGQSLSLLEKPHTYVRPLIDWSQSPRIAELFEEYVCQLEGIVRSITA